MTQYPIEHVCVRHRWLTAPGPTPSCTRAAGCILILLTWVIAITGASPVLAQETYLLEAGQWQKQTAFDPATPEGQLQAIRVAIAREQPEQALELAQLWVDSHPGHPMLVDAYLLRGDSYVAGGQYFKALFDYEQVVRQYPATPQFAAALQREYKIAKLFASGVKRQFLGMRILSAAGEAEELLIRIQERSPGSEIGEMASLALGDFYFDRAQMTSAAEAYELFMTNYPNSQYSERAMMGLIRASLATFKGPRFDPTGLIEAAQRIKTFRQRFPAAAQRIGGAALLVRIDESLALKTLYAAQWYEKRGQKLEAIYTYQRVVRDYPQAPAAHTSVQRLTEMGAPVAVSTLPMDRHPPRDTRSDGGGVLP